ncbi:DUF6427 family protein [Flavobacteriaceae bacterium F08102]|nr:DUF6427 family protein [Flavobacteriaceae bacterium F08102]
MLAKFFNKSSPINTLLIIIVLFVVYILASCTLPNAHFSLSYVGNRTVNLSLVAISFFLTNFIIRKNELSKENTYALLLLVCFYGMFPHSTENSNYLILHILLLFSARRLYSLKSMRRTKEKLFDAGFWTGLIMLLNPFGLIFIVFIYSAIINYKKFTLRNSIIPLVGIITPIFIYGVYLFALDRFDELLPSSPADFSIYNYGTLPSIIALTLVIGFLLWTIIPATIKIMTVKLEFKSSWYLVLMHLLTSLLFILPQINKNGAELIFLFFPTAVIFTNYLQQNSENWFKEVFLYLFLITSITVNFL